jgi:hypothetical protein
MKKTIKKDDVLTHVECKNGYYNKVLSNGIEIKSDEAKRLFVIVLDYSKEQRRKTFEKSEFEEFSESVPTLDFISISDEYSIKGIKQFHTTNSTKNFTYQVELLIDKPYTFDARLHIDTHNNLEIKVKMT